MYKRALMLTAATVALLAGPAYAAGPTTITDKQTTNQKTSTTGDLTIDTTGSVVVTSTTPAITVDSNNFVTINSSGLVSNKDTTNAIGVQLNTGFTGGFTSDGSITVTGTGTDKTGLYIKGTGTFTGDINLQSSSEIAVTGANSYGIRMDADAILQGDLTLAGTIGLGSSTTTPVSANTGVYIAGDIFGDVLQSGTINVIGGSTSATAANSRGFIMLGTLNGSFTNSGTISTRGSATVSSSNNPEGGIALAFASSISGGILNSGKTSSSDSTSEIGIISVSGTGPAVYIAPNAVGSTNTDPIVIGYYNDAALGSVYSFLNRGTISVQPVDPNYGITGVFFGGLSSASDVTLTGGIYNSGAIRALTTGSSTAIGNASATALWISQYVNLPTIVNASASDQGIIYAGVSTTGSYGGIATAIRVDANANIGSSMSITNQSSIQAIASATDSTVTTLQAFGIRDLSGSVDTISNSGTISAIVSGGNSDSSLVFARAIDVSLNTTGVSLGNTGTILGDVLLGTGADTVTVEGSTASNSSTITGDLIFNGTASTGGNDVLMIGHWGSVTGQVIGEIGSAIDVSVGNQGSLNIQNTADTVYAGAFNVDTGGTLGLSLTQAFNRATGVTAPALVTANSLNLANNSTLNLGFGGFVSDVGGTASKFILFDVSGAVVVGNASQIIDSVTATIPYLFTGSVCGYNQFASQGFTACAAPAPTNSQLVLNLASKSKDLVFASNAHSSFGYQLFDYVNDALATDDELGAALISAVTDATSARDVYNSFAPDVTGASRAVVISLTDQATGPVGARQRALRMYANQGGSATLWGQEFAQRLNGSDSPGGMYHNTGFGFALGVDGGDPRNGRYGGALTFYSGDTTENAPRQSKTNNEYYMLSLYSNWRGKGLFFDTQANVGFGSLNGTRKIDAGTVVRTADSKRNSLFLTGGFTTGAVLASGGTSIIPLLSIDGMTMREDGYTETNGGTGVDLRVNPYYANSARAYVGTSVRQDLNFGDFFLQPEARIGYRYDFLADPVDIKASFASVTPVSQFTLTGPDPGKGNVVAGGSLAVTTDAWSIGLNYDYIRSSAGSVSQSGTITLVGRI